MNNNDDEKVKSAERDSYHVVMKNIFQGYFQKWIKETQFISSTHMMFENKNYQAIIDLGWDAVPPIIEQLRVKPEHLFKALKRITGVSPIKPGHEGHLYEMASDWIEWYDNRFNKE
jgi:hypothetical protein